MGGVIDTIVVILFVGVLFVIIGGFNRQMVEKNKDRQKRAQEIDAMLKNKKEKQEKGKDA